MWVGSLFLCNSLLYVLIIQACKDLVDLVLELIVFCPVCLADRVLMFETAESVMSALDLVRSIEH